MIKALNRSIVLNTIKALGPIARAEVARRTGLSPATVTGLTADLIEEGLIFEKAAGDSSGGRPPILLALNPKGGYVVGIKLTETELIGAMTDLEATIIARETVDWNGHDFENAVKGIVELTRRLTAAAGIKKKQVIGLGIGLAGIIDARSGILRNSPYLNWNNLPVRELVQSRLRMPVYVDNDVNTLTLAEKWFGAGQEVSNFLTVTIGRGVGMGIVVNGQFYRGSTGGAGEFGHTLVDLEGPVCACGKRGCLEAYVGDPALVRFANQACREGKLSREVEKAEELVALAEAGETGARDVLEQAGFVLGHAVGSLINVLNPELIVLGGEGTRSGEWLFKPMREAIAAQVVAGMSHDTQIRVEPWGDDAWARGAASLVLHKLFEAPIQHQPEYETL
jgi:N-acetylglucosamine repressor